MHVTGPSDPVSPIPAPHVAHAPAVGPATHLDVRYPGASKRIAWRQKDHRWTSPASLTSTNHRSSPRQPHKSWSGRRENAQVWPNSELSPPDPLHSILWPDGLIGLGCKGALPGVLWFSLLLWPSSQVPKSLCRPNKLSSCKAVMGLICIHSFQSVHSVCASYKATWKHRRTVSLILSPEGFITIN